MAVKLRLMRMGKKKHPTYRVVATDARSPRDGRFIELIGRYDPHPHPSVVEIDNDRAVHWLTVGAQPSAAVRKLLEISGAWGEFRVSRGDSHVVAEPVVPVTTQRKSKKVRQREADAAAEAAAPAEAAEAGEAADEAPPSAEVAEEAPAEAAEEPAAETSEEPVAEAAEEPETDASEESSSEAAEGPAAEVAEEPAAESEESKEEA